MAAKIVEIQSCRLSHKAEEQRKSRLIEYVRRFHNSSVDVFEEDVASASSSELTRYERVVLEQAFFPSCIKIWSGFNPSDLNPYPDCWVNYLRYIKNYHKHLGLNVFILSNEIITSSFGKINETNSCARILNGMLTSLGAGSEIDIVYTHRRYFDFLVSMHNQQWDKKFGVKPKLEKWPGNGGIETPTLEEYISGYNVHTFVRALHCFREVSKDNNRANLRILNYREGRVLSSFFNVISRNESVASKMLNITKGAIIKNAASRRSKIPYDRIAIAAYKRNLIPAGMSRARARALILANFKANGDVEMMHRCPSQEFYSNLLENSLQLEAAAAASDEGTIVKDMLLSAIAKKKFCDVDGDGMVQRYFAGNISIFNQTESLV